MMMMNGEWWWMMVDDEWWWMMMMVNDGELWIMNYAHDDEWWILNDTWWWWMMNDDSDKSDGIVVLWLFSWVHDQAQIVFSFLRKGINPLVMPLLFNSDGDTGESNHLLELEDEDAYFGRAVEQKQCHIDMQLHYACANGDPVNVGSFLESKMDVNSKDYCGRTPLHVACTCKSTGAKEVVRLLLNHGGDANVVDNVGMTCMDIVIKARNLSIRKVLEGNGIECDQCIPLQSALEQKARESSWLLKASDLELKREIGTTLKSVVHLADWHGSLVVVKCVKMQHHVMMRQLRMSNSLRLSHAVEDLDTAETEPSTPDSPDRAIEHDGTEELLHEIQLLSTLRHPDLVLFLGACLEPGMPTMFVTE